MFWDLFSLKEYVKLVENNIYEQNQGRNVMKNIKVIMCDIDGTLLNSKGIVTTKTIDAIKKVREQGILFGISTGRDVPSVKRLFGKWGIGGLVDMVVGSNGGEIYDYKTDYYEENFALPGNLIANIMEHYKDMDLQEYLDREDRYSMIFFVDENMALIKSVIQINGWVIQLNDFEL